MLALVIQALVIQALYKRCPEIEFDETRFDETFQFDAATPTESDSLPSLILFCR